MSACAALSSTLNSVRARHAELDSREYHCVDGSVESDYHPYLPDALELPSPESLRTTPTTLERGGAGDRQTLPTPWPIGTALARGPDRSRRRPGAVLHCRTVDFLKKA